MPLLDMGDHRLEYAWHGPGPGAAPTLVFLHEGLGSVSGWRDFPARLAEATELGALVYSRRGYGGSDPLARPFAPDFMHLEARVALPAVLAALSVRRAILVGHSDGASIALIHASDRPPSVVGLLLEAPHVFVEELTLASIAQLRERVATPDLLERFARHHGANAGPLVAAWTDVWLSLAFRDWSLDASLGTIGCPVLVVQGEDDEYGTLEQVQRIARAVPSRLETLFLPRCGHAPHRDQPVKTLEAMTRFARGLL